jgi:hypothetical protein
LLLYPESQLHHSRFQGKLILIKPFQHVRR